jgi:hypothetical protein
MCKSNADEKSNSDDGSSSCATPSPSLDDESQSSTPPTVINNNQSPVQSQTEEIETIVRSLSIAEGNSGNHDNETGNDHIHTNLESTALQLSEPSSVPVARTDLTDENGAVPVLPSREEITAVSQPRTHSSLIFPRGVTTVDVHQQCNRRVPSSSDTLLDHALYPPMNTSERQNENERPLGRRASSSLAPGNEQGLHALLRQYLKEALEITADVLHDFAEHHRGGSDSSQGTTEATLNQELDFTLSSLIQSTPGRSEISQPESAVASIEQSFSPISPNPPHQPSMLDSDGALPTLTLREESEPMTTQAALDDDEQVVIDTEGSAPPRDIDEESQS